MPTTTPPATPTAAPNQPWWHSLADHIMSWFSPQSNKADAMSMARGANYAITQGKKQAADTNKVIDEASK